MDTETNVTAADVAQTLSNLGEPAPAPWKRWAKWAIVAVIVLAALYFFFGRNTAGATKYITAEVTRGDLTVTVTATGNLEPRNQVDIGSELSGTLRAVNVDVNDTVKAGQLLAALDTSRLKAQVSQAQSSLASAEARVVQAQASAKESRANFQRLLKVRELSGNKIPSQQDLDLAEATVARDDGEIVAAKAAVQQAQASLEAVQTDLSKTEIRSPINGVVLVRSVELGQTVAASLQAPVLFTLAEDLKKMELHVSVDEADVGSVQVGQQATFTVDAFPNRRFSAHITQVHFASNNTQKSTSSSTGASTSATSTGVVTYETVLEVDNSELLLRPGMTATASIVTTSIKDATLVPNAALRFTPEGQQLGATQQRGALSALIPQMGRRQGAGREQGAMRKVGRVWVLEDGKPVLALFRAGETDGRVTQVLPLGESPNLGRAGAQPEAAQRMREARERKVEPGTAVIVDSETPQKS
ncbi:MAG TPA: efflux RND transporter periplasmic adaptor subunit [Steroidobacteraceae bacterium]|jgi:HlyD family secretion protein